MRNSNITRLVFGISIPLFVVLGFLILRAQRTKQGSLCPLQSEVASTGQFDIVSSSDPSVAAALDASDLRAVRAHLGTRQTLRGVIVKVYTTTDHVMTFLNFAPGYLHAAAITLNNADYAKVPDVQTLYNHQIIVSGILKEHINSKGDQSMQIELLDTAQIKVVQ